ncbi:uncharacterized protein LOC118756629 isoform X2 [Rhagoletis pomonella]|uniref:uncharacterized protein LOC118756629 isoform X2 n=1 Tax=Rhagoletis pomonella TaxID=28610 RepID=UPI0017806DBB|nr:uncharacterized protein LOC118756629 isoform X2 [Rhagoletis pomonella]
MTGEIQDKDMDEVASMLPLETLTAVREIEEKLQLPDFAQSMTAYLYKMKGTSEDVSNVTRKVFTHDLLEKYNWDGRWEKKSLAELTLVNTTLRA